MTGNPMKVTRRGFLGTAVGALGTGLLAGCTDRLPRYLVPHAIPPDDAIPGIARHYRTVCRECPAGCGATARVREGRAVKLEGNPEDPIGRGALCPRGQAAIEGLYSPERLGAPRSGEREVGWEEAEKLFAAGVQHALDSKQLVVVVTRPEQGKLRALFGTWLEALGQAPRQVVTFDAMDRPWLREAQARAFGAGATALPNLPASRLILSVGDDFLEEGSPVEYARGLADQRAAGGRLIYVGPRLSLTAAAADEWVSVQPGTEGVFVLGLLRQVVDRLGAESGLPSAVLEGLHLRLAPYDVASVASRTASDPKVLRDVAAQLMGAGSTLCLGPGRAVAGADAAAVAEAIQVLNAVLGSVGRTLPFVASAPAQPSMELAEFTRKALAGEVGAVVFHHADPLGYGPVYAGVADALAHIPFIAAFVNAPDSTSRKAHLTLADNHFLENWSDVRVRPGVVGIQQPVMEPVLGTRAAADELLAVARLLGKTTGLPEGSFGELIRQSYQPKEIEQGLRLEEVAVVVPDLQPGVLASLPRAVELRGPEHGLPLVVATTFRELDGRTPRSALLQELPDPISGFAWTGWVELHPTTAHSFGLKTGDVVELEGPGGRNHLPAFVTDSIRNGAVAVPVGDATALLDRSGFIGAGARVTLRSTGARVERPHPATGGAKSGKQLVQTVDGAAALPAVTPLPSLYPPIEHPVHRWAMAIDLDRCNGCSACTAACYVENNLAVVGPEQVSLGRSMSWLPIMADIDRSRGKPDVSFLPLGCQQCTAAPCESVCPTYATYHTKEGLNAQVYARCIGTRYCENNCPYGVRRFNFYDWPRAPSERLGLNPDVTVRDRGVTEKCTLCVQRIRAGEEQAKFEKRTLQDGDITSACAASCPTRAIVFGDLKDPKSTISRMAADGRAYKLLDELNTQPGVFYLARRRRGPT
jgi:anaerobic selenocysteine-containing dehydrogenase/Fe-S-cluster-containing dehydrogenase component